MQALWRGERSFAGEHWSFEGASFAPSLRDAYGPMH